MPLSVDISNTEAYRANPDAHHNTYTLGVTCMVTGVPVITEDNLRKFATRALLVHNDPHINLSALMDEYRPYIGTVTNASSLTRAAFLRSFPDWF